MSKVNPLKDAFSMALPGELVEAIIGGFCETPYKGDDTAAHCSVAVAEGSICATDGRSALVIGQPKSHYRPTKRKEALIESYRAKQYGHPVNLETIETNIDAKTGEARELKDVSKIIAGQFQTMVPLAEFNPSALVAIGKAAKAAGAQSIQLFSPEGDTQTLGFKFDIPLRDEFMDLFSEYQDSTPVQGVFVVRKMKETEKAHLTVEENEKPKETKRKKKVEVMKGDGGATEVIEIQFPVPGQPAKSLVAQIDSVDIDEVRQVGEWSLPRLSDLEPGVPIEAQGGEYADQLLQTLHEFHINATLAGFARGPSVTQYQVSLSKGQKPGAVVALADSLKMNLAVTGVRIEAPVPGRNAVGIEVPNKQRETVRLRDLVAAREFWTSPPLTVALGKGLQGQPVYGDLSEFPHLLMAGATGSGKSIGIASILTSLLLRNTPEQLRLVLVDPKMVELQFFAELPHLLCPVITDNKEVPGVLRALWREMDRRYEVLREKGARNINTFNEAHPGEAMPRIVAVIDELADLMLTAKSEVETSIQSLTQKARAVGIHVIVATQRPSVDVITGTIKANIPSRIAFMTVSSIDSRTILDQTGAEGLLGKGDMLFLPPSCSKPERVQGAYVSEKEIESVVESWKRQGKPRYEIEPLNEDHASHEGDPLWKDAVRFTLQNGQVSTSMLQRHLSIGFQRASRLIDLMSDAKVIEPRNGPRPPKLIMDADDVAELLERDI